MRSLLTRSVVWMLMLMLMLCMATAVCGAEGASETPADQSQVAATSTLDAAIPSYKMGLDVYQGVSNMPGKGAYSDGMWAASGTFFPSIAYLQWDDATGRSAKVSIGTGSLYTASASAVDQPVEAFLQMPVGKAVLTVGKYWIPFAQQEWLYESKPGVMAQWEGDKTSLTLSTNYSQDSHRQFAYARGGYQLAEDVQIGLSYAIGRGFCSNTIHDHGFAADTNIGYKGWRLFGEYNHFTSREEGNDFHFISGKLYYEKLGVLKPFVGVFSWNDRGGELGDFNSTVLGADYQASPQCSIQGAVSTASGDSISWLQVHWTWEKNLSSK